MQTQNTLIRAIIIVVLLHVYIGTQVYGQSPDKLSYQAVVRDGSANLVSSASVGMQLSLLQGSASGESVYTETHTASTNANGLISITIGSGTVVSGDFTAIDWANGPYFIKVETDPAGGTSYSITGTSQLLSVPYALYAKSAGSFTETDPKFTSWDKRTGITIKEIQISDLQAYLTAEVDGSVTNEIELPTSGTAGDMAYWNGTSWVAVAATSNEGATLQMIGGVPTWTGGTPPPPSVTSTATGKVWMDRNLGASQVATSSTDALAYGDLYQWGRLADGHQLRTSSTRSTLATSDTPGHGDFITTSGSLYDWRSSKNDNLWQGANGINNPCPSGYRVPTVTEWYAEQSSLTSKNAAGAFASPLKLTLAGRRDYNGSLSKVGELGSYWSSTVVGSTNASFLSLSSSSAGIVSFFRVSGFSVRCIKD